LEKIAELSGLVAEIEEVQPDDRKNAERKPLQGNWRERQPLSEVMKESQMPTIAEDKLWPRRTLGEDAIQAIRLSDQSSTESPDLGPPPVASFDYEDPQKNTSPLVHKILPEPVILPLASEGETEETPVDLSTNLEMRRKRRDGQPKLQIRRRSLLPQSPAKGEGEGEVPSMLRTGAKRKLADREGDRAERLSMTSDFTFSRRLGEKDVKATEEPEKSTSEEPTVPRPATQNPTRRVLADKSVNMSPRKASQPDEVEKDWINKPAANAPGRRRRISSIPLVIPSDETPVVPPTEVAPPAQLPQVPEPPPPQTPADPRDLFSPNPSEPSTVHEPGRGDTPPPGDLSLSFNATGARPSRRAARNGAVNYAEPSLISKMRRPDKKMVDAITGLQDPRRAMSGSAGASEGGRRTSAQLGAVLIKQEPIEDGDVQWRDIPPAENITIERPSDAAGESPLSRKSDVGEDVPSLSRSDTSLATSNEPSAASATISALMAASRKHREPAIANLPRLSVRHSSAVGEIEATARKLEELDIYDFKNSSSPAASSDSGTASAVRTLAAGSKTGTNVVGAKSQRRHSSVLKPAEATEEIGRGAVPSRIERSERALSRRRSMII